MQLNREILKKHTKQELVDTFNTYTLHKKITLIGEFSKLFEVLEDEKGKYYLRSMGFRIFAKQYLSKTFDPTYGYTKEIYFYYIKDDSERDQEDKIKNLIDG